MTNEQTAVMLIGIRAEITSAINNIDDVNGEGEVMLRDLSARLATSITVLQGDTRPMLGES